MKRKIVLAEKAQQSLQRLGETMRMLQEPFRAFKAAINKAHLSMMGMLCCPKCGVKGSLHFVSARYVRCQKCKYRLLFKTVLKHNKNIERIAQAGRRGGLVGRNLRTRINAKGGEFRCVEKAK